MRIAKAAIIPVTFVRRNSTRARYVRKTLDITEPSRRTFIRNGINFITRDAGVSTTTTTTTIRFAPTSRTLGAQGV